MGAWAILPRLWEAKGMARAAKKKPAKAGFFTKVLLVALLAALVWQMTTLRQQVEEAQLRSPEYQKRLCCVLASGLSIFLDQ